MSKLYFPVIVLFSFTFSEFFDKYEIRDLPLQGGEDKTDKGDKASSRFRSSMQYPFFRLKDYSRLLQKIADNFEVVSTFIILFISTVFLPRLCHTKQIYET